MEEKTQETQVSFATLAAINGFINNPFIQAGIYLYEPGGEWTKVAFVKFSAVPGKITVALENLTEQDIDATYMLGFRIAVDLSLERLEGK